MKLSAIIMFLANLKLKESKDNIKIFSIAALYGSTNTKNREYKPDFEAHDPNDIISIVTKLAT